MVGNGVQTGAALPVPEIPKEDLIKHAVHEMAAARANTDPMPGPVAMAFDERNYVRVPGTQLEIRPLVAYDLQIAKAFNLAVYQFILEMAKPEAQRQNVDWEDDEKAFLVWLFTRPCKEVRAVVRKGGKELAMETACETISDTIGPVEMGMAIDAVLMQFSRSLSTAVEYAASEKPGVVDGQPVKAKVFQDAGATQPMASAGG